MISKLIGNSEFEAAVRQLPCPLVFTNGVFDLLHRGHVTYLAAARDLGASLIVAVNTDESVRRLQKGPERPFNTAFDRAWVLSALESVTAVTLFDEDTPCEVLRRVRPDIYVKGSDYDMDTLEEARIVRSWPRTTRQIPPPIDTQTPPGGTRFVLLIGV